MSDRNLATIIAVVVFLVLAGLLHGTYFQKEEHSVSVAPTVEVTAPKETETRIKVRVTGCRRDYGRTVMRGTVQNTGNVDLHYIRVRSIWKNQQGGVVSTDMIYALTGGSLAPGKLKEFEDVSDLTSVARCNAEGVDWW